MLVSDWRWAVKTHSLSVKKTIRIWEKIWGSQQRTSCNSKSTARLKILSCRYWEVYSDLHRSQEFEKLCNNKTAELTTSSLSQTVSQLQISNSLQEE